MRAQQSVQDDLRHGVVRKWLPILLVAGISGAFMLKSTSAFAHGVYFVTVPRRTHSEPVPTVDGIRGSIEYAGSNYFEVPYRPSLNAPPFKVYLLSNPWDLYVFVEGLYETGHSTYWTEICLAFDTRNDGGRVPRNDDIRFRISQGYLQGDVLRGNDAGEWASDPAVTDWEVRSSANTAEFRIPLSYIGGGDPGAQIGFYVVHDIDSRLPGDEYDRPQPES